MNNESNNKNNVNNTNNVSTTSTPNTANNTGTTSTPNINPAISNIKESQNINTSAFANTSGPRIDTTSAPSNVSINTSAFNASHKNNKVNNTDKVENKPTKSKFGLILFLIILIGFVVFLPEINNFIDKMQTGVNNENIVDGELRCNLNKSTDKFDVIYEQNLPFKNNQLKSLKYIVTTKGDVVEDKNELEELDATCNKLSELAANVVGLEVNCEFAGDKMIESQTIDYETVKIEDMKSAYVEVGGVAPEFEADEDINDVQKSLQAVGYTCKKIK